MFGRKKDAAKISDRTPVFHVRYIGHTETFVASGTGCSYGPVQRLWDNSPGEKHLRKVAVHISPTGLSLRYATNTATATTTTAVAITTTTGPHMPRGREEDAGEHRQDFLIENISFCNADRAVNEKIFSWIVRSGDPGPDSPRKLECHAVLCSTRQKAQTMAVVLSRAFHIAYKDWRAHHRDHQPRHAAAAAPGSRAGGKVTSQATSKVTSKGATGSSPSGTPGTGGGRAATSVARGGSSASSASSGGLGSAGSGGSGGGGAAAAAAAAAAETTLLSLAGPRSHGVTSSPTGTTSSRGSRDTSSVVGVEKSAQASNSNNNNNALAKTLAGNKGEAPEKQQQQQHQLQQQQQGRKEVEEAGFWVDSILDPETEAVLRDMDGLNADFDLDDTDSN